MDLADTKFCTLYYHELWWLSQSVAEKCEQVFKETEVPEEGYVIQVDPAIHSVISSLLSDAANIKKLVSTSSVKAGGENGERFRLRKERANELGDFVASLGIKELLNPKVRNTLEHFDEYLDQANYDISKKAEQGRFAVYNMILSHWEAMSPKVYPIRLYVSSEKKFYNMKWSIDLGLLHSEAISIVEKLKTIDVFSKNEQGGLMIRI
ncbi:hypothetical protein [Pseudomonas rustica]|uniref:hypothetical protein n=1 Tax=Pseudomonas rustica TaxID=2827099 RepID=UPI001BAED774|nr:hypothetical protein [Pseudomonas rustica]MBS4088687.1 hypothetical protein [Pseudomonas rustica]